MYSTACKPLGLVAPVFGKCAGNSDGERYHAKPAARQRHPSFAGRGVVPSSHFRRSRSKPRSRTVHTSARPTDACTFSRSSRFQQLARVLQ